MNNVLVDVNLPPTLGVGDTVKTYFTLGSAAVSASGACGGNIRGPGQDDPYYLILWYVSKIIYLS